MSLHRWSLPSRSIDQGLDQQSKYPTVHVGHPATRRRANISSTFASLFDRSENRSTASSNPQQAIGPPKPLSSRQENVAQTSKAKPSHVPELQENISLQFEAKGHDEDTTLLRKSPGADGHPTGLVPPVLRKASQILKLKKIRNFSLSSDDAEPKTQTERTQSPFNTLDSLERVRDPSSSYQSTGTRSPSVECLSPEPGPLTQVAIAEYSHFGAYPSHSSSDQLKASSGEPSWGRSTEESLLNVLGENITVTSPRSKQGSDTFLMEERSLILGSSVPESSHISQLSPHSPECVPAQRGQGTSKSGESLRITLEATREAPEVSEVNFDFKPLEIPGLEDFPGDDALSTLKNPSSMDRLRASTDTEETTRPMIQTQAQTRVEEQVPTSSTSTTNFGAEGRVAARAQSHEPTQCSLSGSHESSSSIAQRIHKFKFKKWVKKVYRRTRVRFGPTTKVTTDMVVPTRSKSAPHKLRTRKRRQTTAKKQRRLVPWNHSQAVKRSEKQKDKQQSHPGESLRVPKAKRSVQLPLTRSAREQHSAAGHKRAQSCPAQTAVTGESKT